MRPLPFVWPYWPLFAAVMIWAFSPEFRIVRTAQKAVAKEKDSRDAGSVALIAIGGAIALAIAIPLAWVRALQVPAGLAPVLFAIGVAMLIAGSLLRRHCWRLLAASFTGDVRARPDQPIVSTGAYRWLRHPSYTAGILMNTGIGLALGSWGSALVLVIASFAVYAYRISVEEQALLEVVGEPYRRFMLTRRRLIPFIY
jgi:protein-S-isoprenylcysteine O-methyltransferase Ste14